MELWDVYDENRVATGKTHVRGVPLGTGEYHLVSDIWLVNGNQEILLTKRHPDKPYGLMWECSGGSVLAGETSIEGALRELSEEVGIRTVKEQLRLIHAIRLKERFVDTYITRQNVTIKDITIQQEEVVDAKFVTFEQLLEMWKQGIVVPKSRFLLYKDRIREFIQPSS
ncbi:NUDIX hydrolase [Lacrimispora celerecrescens]|uniref:NUDIX hydrolase n=1 Tax=Lacrimispora celerecrescens TaxID=29354 RepID=A0A084JL77_9FIRM|nr:NUDIX domain-containing protein [Lacrimispora celerecrescens]KEZ89711.1 NUDIX hydrolase [Lacrimispora celerecrescens]